MHYQSQSQILKQISGKDAQRHQQTGLGQVAAGPFVRSMNLQPRHDSSPTHPSVITRHTDKLAKKFSRIDIAD